MIKELFVNRSTQKILRYYFMQIACLLFHLTTGDRETYNAEAEQTSLFVYSQKRLRNEIRTPINLNGVYIAIKSIQQITELSSSRQSFEGLRLCEHLIESF